MGDSGRFRVDPMGELGWLADRAVGQAQETGKRKAKAADQFVRGRVLTAGERVMVEAMFGPNPGYARALIYPRNFWWPYPNDRAMAPAGNIHFPKQDFQQDFSVAHVPVPLRALFMHEATHLYQWYELKQWVIARGITDREYTYTLEPGKELKDYGLEQMGQIVQDYYRLKHGLSVRSTRYRAQDYEHILPVKRS